MSAPTRIINSLTKRYSSLLGANMVTTLPLGSFLPFTVATFS